MPKSFEQPKNEEPIAWKILPTTHMMDKREHARRDGCWDKSWRRKLIDPSINPSIKEKPVQHYRWKNWKSKLNDLVKATAIHSRKNCLAYIGPNHGNHGREWHIRVEIESRGRGDMREPTVSWGISLNSVKYNTRWGVFFWKKFKAEKLFSAQPMKKFFLVV